MAEHIAYLSCARADIARGHVGVGADISVKLQHEALAERHYLTVGFALGVKVRAALAAADGQAGQRILEYLLEAEEFDDAEVDRWMQSQAALVGADGAVELHAVAGVDVSLTVVVYPGHSEFDLSFGVDKPLEQGVASVFLLVSVHHDSQRIEHFSDSLMEFRLRRILLDDLSDDFVNI